MHGLTKMKGCQPTYLVPEVEDIGITLADGTGRELLQRAAGLGGSGAHVHFELQEIQHHSTVLHHMGVNRRPILNLQHVDPTIDPQLFS
jgi:hypothetical protein